MKVPLNEFYSTFSASIRSVGTAVTLAFVGVYLHRRNFVSSEGKRTLARISQQVTFPLFLFTKICYCNQDWSSEPCPDVTKSLRDVWILLFWPAVVVGIGLSVGYGAAIVSGTPKSQFRSVLAACGFGNSTGLPITLLTVVHANFPSTSDLGKIDPTLFLSVYLLLYPVLQWGVGGWLLAPEEDEEEMELERRSSIEKLENGKTEEEEEPGSDAFHHQKKHGRHGSMGRNVLNNKQKESFYKLSRKAIGETDASLYISDADLVGFAARHTDPDVPPPPEAPPGEQTALGTYQSTPLSPIQDEFKNVGPTGSFSPPPRHDEVVTLLPPAGETTGLLSMPQTDRRDSATSVRSTKSQYESEAICETCQKIMTRCLQPPVIGALAGIFVAATPLRSVFVDLARSSRAPLQWLFDGLYAVGQAAVPINMIILGCNLSASHQTSQAKKEDPEAYVTSNLLSQKTMIAIVIGKMLIMPMIGMMLALFLDAFVLDIPDGTHDSEHGR